MEMYRRTFAEINLDHLAFNIKQIQSRFPNRFLCPMLKANAYGHGDVQLARFFETMGIQQFGVCLIEEGLLLRNLGVKAEILVFRGFDQVGAEKIIQYNLTPVVSTWEHIDHLENAVTTSPVGIHLKFDTGMNRLGFRPEEAQSLFERLWQNRKIRVKALLTHLYSGENAVEENLESAAQLRALDGVSKVFKPLNVFCHALNTAGIISLTHLQSEGKLKPDHPLNLQEWGMRPGLLIYGYNPIPEFKELQLKPVMSLKSVVNSFRRLKVGETVSYGGTWKAQRESVIAIVPIGYADGYHRILSNQGTVLFAGHRVPVIGNVCMDYLMVDVTDVVADQDLSTFKDKEVILFGAGESGSFISPEELAVKAKSIVWEMLTSVGERVPRVFVGSAAKFVNQEVGG